MEPSSEMPELLMGKGVKEILKSLPTVSRLICIDDTEMGISSTKKGIEIPIQEEVFILKARDLISPEIFFEKKTKPHHAKKRKFK